MRWLLQYTILEWKMGKSNSEQLVTQFPEFLETQKYHFYHYFPFVV